MGNIIHALFRFPLLSVLVVSSIFLIAGLILCDWADRRRDRRLRALTAQQRTLRTGATGRNPEPDWQTRIKGALPKLILPATICFAAGIALLFWTHSPRTVKARVIETLPSRSRPALSNALSLTTSLDASNSWLARVPKSAHAPSAAQGALILAMDPEDVTLWAETTPKDSTVPILVSRAPTRIPSRKSPAKTDAGTDPSRREIVPPEPVRLLLDVR